LRLVVVIEQVYDWAMLETLREAIEDLEIVPSSDELADALALRSRLDAKISAAVAHFDAFGLWGFDYSTSMVAWLRTFGHMTSRDAARTASIAKRLRMLPVTRAAWADGTLSSGQIQAIVANVSRRHAALFAAHEEELIPRLAALSVAETAEAMQDWASKARDSDPEPPGPPQRCLHLSSMLDGRFRLDGEFDTEGGSLLSIALRLAETKDGPADEARVPSQRRGDALVDVCRFFLDHQQTHRGGRHRPHLNITVTFGSLARLLRARFPKFGEGARDWSPGTAHERERVRLVLRVTRPDRDRRIWTRSGLRTFQPIPPRRSGPNGRPTAWVLTDPLATPTNR
jgi:cytochrome c553